MPLQSMPPLNSLRAFEAAARYSNFRKAADELHVTPAAVSHQVKALEDYLGIQLFRRRTRPRALELTEAARACLPRLREGFDALAIATALIKTHSARETLTVKVPPSFAVKWLGRRIDRFVSAHPDIDVHIDASPQTIDGRPDEGGQRMPSDILPEHIAIRFGTGNYPGCRAEKLFSVALAPMCAPRLVNGEPPLREPADLRHHTLLHDDTLDFDDGRSKWEMWLKAAGVENVDMTRGPHFNHAALALEAAIDGSGIALSYPLLASADLAAGRLVMPFTLAIPLASAYYVVYAEAVADQRKVAAFRNWLFEAAREFSSAAD